MTTVSQWRMWKALWRRVVPSEMTMMEVLVLLKRIMTAMRAMVCLT